MKNKELITQSTILSMGWTKSLIERFLPEPILRPNPYYKKSSSMKLWDKLEVLKLMETESFKLALKKSVSRKKACEKAVETKKKNLSKTMIDISQKINIVIIPDEQLKERTLAGKTNQVNYFDDYYCYNSSKLCEDDIDEETMNRWIVNYIRHNLIDYDEELQKLRGKIGKNSAYITFKTAVLEKISCAYPKYSDECHRQIDYI